MPSSSQYVLPKTNNGKEFEYMVKDCASKLWNQQFSLYGRNGQTQYGIDIYSEDWYIVIQCKNYVSGKTNIKKFLKDINNNYKAAAKQFNIIRRFVVATALDRDNKIQDQVRNISNTNPRKQHRQSSKKMI